jgi:hypothetical protein
LNPDKTDPGALVGQVAYAGGSIKVHISPEDKTMSEAVALAAEAVALLASLDAKCRELIAEDSLESYNNGWRFGERVQPDGSFAPFEEPLLSKSEFCARLKFGPVVVEGSSLTFWYDDDRMFWGHGFYVTSFDGVTFKNAHVSMFG